MSLEHDRKPVLVLGIGNILLTDEGIGVRVIDRLQEIALPDNVEILDGGTAGVDLLDILADRQKVIIIDAVDAGCTPGTVVCFGIDQLMPKDHPEVSLHELGIAETVFMTKQLGCAPKEVTVYGIQPENINCGLELSQTLQNAVEYVVELILTELNNPDPAIYSETYKF